MKKRVRFTLTEVLVVVLLISVLAGIGFGGYTYARNSARESATRSLLKQIEAGMEAVNTKLGYCPAAAGFQEVTITFTGDEVTAIKLGGAELPDDVRKEFLRVVNAESLRQSAGTTGDVVLSDSWGGKVYYRNDDNNINKSKFDLLSPGADGKYGKAGDETPAADAGRGDFFEGSDWACDDVANFE